MWPQNITHTFKESMASFAGNYVGDRQGPLMQMADLPATKIIKKK
jgi:hypothetical protein